ncbi:MAG: hypothetical protein KC461_05155 [Dehalococcoidia bacterium]|nr:hypothetical protein [Dehalococcoidia bacterium]MCA9850019.1 hypothetical protein [Dehalococcoidia bacterium]
MKYRLLAALALILPLAVACSSEDGGATASKSPEEGRQQISAAIEGALATSYEFEATVEMSAVGDTPAFTLNAEGAVDAQNDRVRASADLAGLVASMAAGLGGEGSDGASDGIGAMLGMLGAGDLEVVLDGTTAYVSNPLLAFLAPQTGGTSWVSVDLSQGFGEGMPGGDALAPAALLQSPSNILPLLTQVTDVTHAGSEKVRTVDTTRWDATLNAEDLQQLVEAQAAAGAITAEHLDALRAYTQSLSDRVSDIPVSLWIDGDNNLRRITLTATGTDEATGEEATASVNLEFFSYDGNVEVTLPDPADVTPLSSLTSP